MDLLVGTLANVLAADSTDMAGSLVVNKLVVAGLVVGGLVVGELVADKTGRGRSANNGVPADTDTNTAGVASHVFLTGDVDCKCDFVTRVEEMGHLIAACVS